MRVPFIDFHREYKEIKNEVDKSIFSVIRGAYFIMGKHLSIFEKQWASYLGVKDAIGVADGTDALFLALKGLGIGEGDEVIVPSFTFIATALAVSHTGAKPILVDVLEDTHVINPKEIEKKITKKTKAIIPVHLYGNAAPMKEIMALAKKYKLFIVEDAAQAHGAIYNGKKLGTFGEYGCFSFYPTKNLGCFGDGGAVVSNNSALAKNILLLRNYGQEKKYFSEIKGYNSRLDELQASILSAKLKYVDRWIKKRTKLVSRYRKGLEGVVNFSDNTKGCSPSYYVFSIQIEKRDTLQEFLHKKGIITIIHYPVPVHLQKAYKELGFKQGDFPISEKIANTTLSLPLFPQMTIKEVDYVIKIIKMFVKNN